ncbi:MAG: TerB family tellurite resistance protein, partial [Caulobacterales bacterium]|nr:TerB family tellurite resistance protein [Caulobacterales bacterium]
EKVAIRGQMAARFDIDEGAADEMLAQVAWLSKDLPDADSAVDRMTDLVRRAVADKELIELEDMLGHVAEADGAQTPAQADIIARYRSRAGL